MDELAPLTPAGLKKPFFQKVFNCFNIMICDFLSLFYLFCISQVKVFVNLPQNFEIVFFKILELRKLYSTQINKIFYLNHQTVPDQPKLRKIQIKLINFLSVSSIKRRNGSQKI